jgi:hypothetical protein
LVIPTIVIGVWFILSIFLTVPVNKHPQLFALTFLCHLQHLKLMARQMLLDTSTNDIAQRIGRNGIELTGKVMWPSPIGFPCCVWVRA